VTLRASWVRSRRGRLPKPAPPRFLKNFRGNGWSNLERSSSHSSDGAAESERSASEAEERMWGVPERGVLPLPRPPSRSRLRSRGRRDPTRKWSCHDHAGLSCALPSDPSEATLRAELQALL
jgi:hypothetical protein